MPQAGQRSPLQRPWRPQQPHKAGGMGVDTMLPGRSKSSPLLPRICESTTHQSNGLVVRRAEHRWRSRCAGGRSSVNTERSGPDKVAPAVAPVNACSSPPSAAHRQSSQSEVRSFLGAVGPCFNQGTAYNVEIMATRRPVQAFEPSLILAGGRRLRDIAPFHYDVMRALAVRY